MLARSCLLFVRCLIAGALFYAMDTLAGPVVIDSGALTRLASGSHSLALDIDDLQIKLHLRNSPSLVSVEAAPSSNNHTWHYAGTVENEPDSWVRISLSPRGDWVSGLIRYRAQLFQLQTRPSGLIWSQAFATAQPQTPTATRVLPLSIVIDSSYNEVADGLGRRRALALINQVDGLFQEQLGLGIELLAARVLHRVDQDPMRQSGGSIEDLLMAFRNYRQADSLLPAASGAVHLFSGAELFDRRMGLAYTAGVCRADGHDVSVSRTQLELVTLAHELAHSLGALHDDASECGPHGMLMDATLRRGVRLEMSECSVRSIRPVLQRGCFRQVGVVAAAISAYPEAFSDLQSPSLAPTLKSAVGAGEPVSPFVLVMIACVAVGLVRRHR